MADVRDLASFRYRPLEPRDRVGSASGAAVLVALLLLMLLSYYPKPAANLVVRAIPVIFAPLPPAPAEPPVMETRSVESGGRAAPRAVLPRPRPATARAMPAPLQAAPPSTPTFTVAISEPPAPTSLALPSTDLLEAGISGRIGPSGGTDGDGAGIAGTGEGTGQGDGAGGSASSARWLHQVTNDELLRFVPSNLLKGPIQASFLMRCKVALMNVLSCRIADEKPYYPGLRRAVLDAVPLMRIKPGQRGGRPIENDRVQFVWRINVVPK